MPGKSRSGDSSCDSHLRYSFGSVTDLNERVMSNKTTKRAPGMSNDGIAETPMMATRGSESLRTVSDCSSQDCSSQEALSRSRSSLPSSQASRRSQASHRSQASALSSPPTRKTVRKRGDSSYDSRLRYSFGSVTDLNERVMSIKTTKHARGMSNGSVAETASMSTIGSASLLTVSDGGSQEALSRSRSSLPGARASRRSQASALSSPPTRKTILKRKSKKKEEGKTPKPTKRLPTGPGRDKEESKKGSSSPKKTPKTKTRSKPAKRSILKQRPHASKILENISDNDEEHDYDNDVNNNSNASSTNARTNSRVTINTRVSQLAPISNEEDYDYDYDVNNNSNASSNNSSVINTNSRVTINTEASQLESISNEEDYDYDYDANNNSNASSNNRSAININTRTNSRVTINTKVTNLASQLSSISNEIDKDSLAMSELTETFGGIMSFGKCGWPSRGPSASNEMDCDDMEATLDSDSGNLIKDWDRVCHFYDLWRATHPETHDTPGASILRKGGSDEKKKWEVKIRIKQNIDNYKSEMWRRVQEHITRFMTEDWYHVNDEEDANYADKMEQHLYKVYPQYYGKYIDASFCGFISWILEDFEGGSFQEYLDAYASGVELGNQKIERTLTRSMSGGVQQLTISYSKDSMDDDGKKINDKEKGKKLQSLLIKKYLSSYYVQSLLLPPTSGINTLKNMAMLSTYIERVREKLECIVGVKGVWDRIDYMDLGEVLEWLGYAMYIGRLWNDNKIIFLGDIKAVDWSSNAGDNRDEECTSMLCGISEAIRAINSDEEEDEALSNLRGAERQRAEAKFRAEVSEYEGNVDFENFHTLHEKYFSGNFVYDDDKGQGYPDAGSLNEFKHRLYKQIKENMVKYVIPLKTILTQQYLTSCTTQLSQWLNNIYTNHNGENYKMTEGLGAASNLPSDVCSVLNIHTDLAISTLEKLSKSVKADAEGADDAEDSNILFMLLSCIYQTVLSRHLTYVNCVRAAARSDSSEDPGVFLDSLICAVDCYQLCDNIEIFTDSLIVKGQSVNLLKTEEVVRAIKESSGALSTELMLNCEDCLKINSMMVAEPCRKHLNIFAAFGERYDDTEGINSVCATFDDYMLDISKILGEPSSFMMVKSSRFLIQVLVGYYVTEYLQLTHETFSNNNRSLSVAMGDINDLSQSSVSESSSAPAVRSPMKNFSLLDKRLCFEDTNVRKKISTFIQRDKQILMAYANKLTRDAFGEWHVELVEACIAIIDHVKGLTEVAENLVWDKMVENMDSGAVAQARAHIMNIGAYLELQDNASRIPDDSLAWLIAEDIFSLLRPSRHVKPANVEQWMKRIKDEVGWAEWAVDYFSTTIGAEPVDESKRARHERYGITNEMILSFYEEKQNEKKEKEFPRRMRRSVDNFKKVLGGWDKLDKLTGGG